MYPVARRLTRVSGTFGPRTPIPLPGGGWSPNFHGGVDFAPLEKNKPLPVYAVGAGVVTISDRHVERGDRSGIDVAIRLDSDRSIWWYGHLSRADVNVGQRVRDGQQIGLMGTTGLTSTGGRSSTGVHLHLERHWPSLNVETDPWPHIKDARDIDGLTSSWQTGNPDVATGDAGKTGMGFLMALTEGQQDELYATVKAIRDGQVHPGGYTYDAAILNLVQGIYPALAKVSAEIDSAAAPGVTVDTAALAARIRDGLGAEIATELGRRLTNE